MRETLLASEQTGSPFQLARAMMFECIGFYVPSFKDCMNLTLHSVEEDSFAWKFLVPFYCAVHFVRLFC